jgi:AcrR family transcriptional regulator
MASVRIEERKTRDRQARRAQIVSAARMIAGREGWPNVTIRRLSDEIAYSQPVLYSHFESRESIIAAVALEGFQELGAALEKARQGAKRSTTVEAVATAYMEFAAASPALYEAMFSLNLGVPFGEPATPVEMRFAFSQLLELFSARTSHPEVVAELFWACLHGTADLSRTGRFPPKRQKERLKTSVRMFSLLVEQPSH